MDSPGSNPDDQLRMDLLRAREDLAAETVRADVGELAGPLVHEVNNLLNNLMLDLALFKHENPGRTTGGLQKVSAGAMRLVAIIKEFQGYRGRPQPDARRIDVNEALRTAKFSHHRDSTGPAHVSDSAADASLPPLDFDLQPALVIQGSRTDFQRFSTFLLKNAAQMARLAGRRGVVRTQRVENDVSLRIDLPAVTVVAESLPWFFAPAGETYPGTSRLELAVCEGIVRRMRGKLVAQALPNGGLSITATWPSYTNGNGAGADSATNSVR
jgi:C4-dicarboxylate-specific signal transduction histidine kinase